MQPFDEYPPSFFHSWAPFLLRWSSPVSPARYVRIRLFRDHLIRPCPCSNENSYTWLPEQRHHRIFSLLFRCDSRMNLPSTFSPRSPLPRWSHNTKNIVSLPFFFQMSLYALRDLKNLISSFLLIKNQCEEAILLCLLLCTFSPFCLPSFHLKS